MGKAKPPNKALSAPAKGELPDHIDLATWAPWHEAIASGEKVAGHLKAAAGELGSACNSGKVHLIGRYGPDRGGVPEIRELPDDINFSPEGGFYSPKWSQEMQERGGRFNIFVHREDVQRALGWPLQPPSQPDPAPKPEAREFKRNPRGAGDKREFDHEWLVREAAVYVALRGLPLSGRRHGKGHKEEPSCIALVDELRNEHPGKVPKSDSQATKILQPLFQRMKQGDQESGGRLRARWRRWQEEAEKMRFKNDNQR
jgi:hypothetical protein